MEKKNVLDLFHASNEEALDVTLSDILPEVLSKFRRRQCQKQRRL